MSAFIITRIQVGDYDTWRPMSAGRRQAGLSDRRRRSNAKICSADSSTNTKPQHDRVNAPHGLTGGMTAWSSRAGGRCGSWGRFISSVSAG